MTLAADVQSLNPGAIVDLFILDATGIGGTVERFHSGLNLLQSAVVFQGLTFTPWPVTASGFAKSGKGTLPQPVMQIANVTGLVSILCIEQDDLIGAPITRRRTLAKYLDAVNFPGGVNPLADPTQQWPDELWYVERKAGEDGIFVRFQLATAFDVQGVKLPRGQIVINCPWTYRGAGCNYTGGPVATITDTPTTNPALDRCGKRLASCKFRFGQFNPLNHGGFPGAGLLR